MLLAEAVPRLPLPETRRLNMSSSPTSFLRRACLVALLLPAFAAAQSDVTGLLGEDCLLAVQMIESACGDCCPTDEPTDECPPECDTCPCCPGVAPAVAPTIDLLAALAPTDRSVADAPGEPVTADAERVFRPPRADPAG